MRAIKQLYWKIAVLLLGGLMLGSISGLEPWDLTQDQRYTLAPATENIVAAIQNPIQVDVFLAGPLPVSYQRLRRETQLLLNKFQKRSPWLQVNWINPFAEEEDPQIVAQLMSRYGLAPENVFKQGSSGTNQQYVFPWVILNRGDRSIRVKLTEDLLGQSAGEKIQSAIESLEYQLTDGLDQLLGGKTQSIGVLRSHGCSPDLKLYDYLKTIGKYYNIAPVDLSQAASNTTAVQQLLDQMDLLVISNPQKSFSAVEQLVLDQHLMGGGRALWLLQPLRVNRDSLFTQSGQSVAFKNELNLDPFLFKYGIRLSTDMVQDLFSAPIVLAQGENNTSQFIPFPWPYYPLPTPNPIPQLGKNSGPVWLRFPGTLDTLKNDLQKTIIIQSSAKSRRLTTPKLIQLQEVETKIDPMAYNLGPQPLGVLVEGTFTSVFQNRILPGNIEDFKVEGNSKMVLITDGHLAENQVDKGSPLPLGFDKWTRNTYDNLNFLTRITHYLMGQNERLAMQSKSYTVAYLDPTKVQKDSQSWIIILMLGSLVWFGGLYWGISQLRKRRLGIY